MVRGVYFNMPQTTSDVLWQILGCIDVGKYYWYNILNQNEVWDRPMGKSFLDKDYYTGDSFAQHIKEDHYLVFVKLQAYLSPGNYNNIDTYEEYQNSDCVLIVLVYDCSYVEIYAKSSSMTDAIYKRAKQNGFSELRYITDETDHRTSMNIM